MLHPHINYQFSSAVWRLEIDPHSVTIFAEIREPDKKKVSFAAISLLSGKVNFDGLETEERWLTGIETAYRGVLLLHNYQSGSVPVHKGIIAVDGALGHTLWSNYVLAFDHLSVNGPVVYDTRIQPHKLFLADMQTGATKRPYDPATDTSPASYIRLPEMMPVEKINPVEVPAASYGNTIDYLEHNNLRIVSLHSLAEGALRQCLYILDENGIVFEDLLNTHIQKLQPESFLIYKDQLIYLKNKSQLKVLNL